MQTSGAKQARGGLMVSSGIATITIVVETKPLAPAVGMRRVRYPQPPAASTCTGRHSAKRDVDIVEVQLLTIFVAIPVTYTRAAQPPTSLWMKRFTDSSDSDERSPANDNHGECSGAWQARTNQVPETRLRYTIICTIERQTMTPV